MRLAQGCFQFGMDTDILVRAPKPPRNFCRLVRFRSRQDAIPLYVIHSQRSLTGIWMIETPRQPSLGYLPVSALLPLRSRLLLRSKRYYRDLRGVWPDHVDWLETRLRLLRQDPTTEQHLSCKGQLHSCAIDNRRCRPFAIVELDL